MTLILVSILVVGYIECPLLSSDGVASTTQEYSCSAHGSDANPCRYNEC